MGVQNVYICNLHPATCQQTLKKTLSRCCLLSSTFISIPASRFVWFLRNQSSDRRDCWGPSELFLSVRLVRTGVPPESIEAACSHHGTTQLNPTRSQVKESPSDNLPSEPRHSGWSNCAHNATPASSSHGPLGIQRLDMHSIGMQTILIGSDTLSRDQEREGEMVWMG